MLSVSSRSYPTNFVAPSRAANSATAGRAVSASKPPVFRARFRCSSIASLNPASSTCHALFTAGLGDQIHRESICIVQFEYISSGQYVVPLRREPLRSSR